MPHAEETNDSRNESINQVEAFSGLCTKAPTARNVRAQAKGLDGDVLAFSKR
ncbi:MAG TPA: hypothetical protein VNO50_00245 [Pyrinomonadaceae bacterium]|nr:hypothetical protein [Pyrinomonadaceae bacterium]